MTRDTAMETKEGVCSSIQPPRIDEGALLGGGSGVTRHAIDPLQWSMDAFIRDRFCTKLEDPDTGRKVR